MALSSDRLAKLVGGELLRATGACPKRAIHDSRRVEHGDLFVALPGHRTDGHLHVADAFERGACAALVSDVSRLPDEAHDVIWVSDPLSALQTWAADHRQRLTGDCIGITGTNGKTTVKRMLRHFLEDHLRTYAAPHNYNTEIGLPLALLSMPADAHVGLFELGTEHPGDIHTLAQILRPSGAVLTSVGPGHLEGLGTVEQVAAEKWSLVESLPPSATAILSAESPHLLQRASRARCRTLTVGFSQGDVRARLLHTTPIQIELSEEQVTLRAPLLGEHNGLNLLLASVTARELGVPWALIKEKANTLSAEPHRLQLPTAPFGRLL
ncbi:MAG TPA: UDP-N-acetylmuramoyl-tripeptide--D-alanyl-D-alanine ligase, partial [Candidatus Acetothermia bacterium]|nr:UDP-N-acetylmuramoyl-tripeptide--D-alanyl-D-alanine ligase [Candidatus Acetothermia bacterium]